MHVRLSRLLLADVFLLSILLILLITFTPKVLATTSSSIISPNGNSTPLQCIPLPIGSSNYADIDEYPTPDDMVSTVGSNGIITTVIDNYTLPNAGVPSGATINNITATIRLIAVGALTGSHQARSTISVDKIAYSGSLFTVSAVAWTTYTQTFTNASWTPAMVNSMYCGVWLVTSNINNWVVLLTQEYINVTYTTAGAWNTVSTWSTFLATRSWQSSGTLSEFLVTRSWLTGASWSNYLISRAWQNVAIWSISLLTLGWHTVTSWSILLLGEDPTTIIVILFLFSVVAFTGIGLYRRRKKNG